MEGTDKNKDKRGAESEFIYIIYYRRKRQVYNLFLVYDLLPKEKYILLLPERKRSVLRDTDKERTTTRHQIKLQVKKDTTLVPFNTE